MQEHLLGVSGIAVTRIVPGCGNFGSVGSSPAFFGQGTSKDEASRVMDTAWDRGITTFDTIVAPGRVDDLAPAFAALDIHLSPGDHDHLTEAF